MVVKINIANIVCNKFGHWAQFALQIIHVVFVLVSSTAADFARFRRRRKLVTFLSTYDAIDNVVVVCRISRSIDEVLARRTIGAINGRCGIAVLVLSSRADGAVRRAIGELATEGAQLASAVLGCILAVVRNVQSSCTDFAGWAQRIAGALVTPRITNSADGSGGDKFFSDSAVRTVIWRVVFRVEVTVIDDVATDANLARDAHDVVGGLVLSSVTDPAVSGGRDEFFPCGAMLAVVGRVVVCLG